MRIPITKYGLPQMVLYPAGVIVAMLLIFISGMMATDIVPVPVILGIEAVLLIVVGWMISFFRDPKRVPPTDENILLAPADGVISDVDIVEEPDVIGGKTLRIGIFLSIFNVHINRVPCAVRIDSIQHKDGQYKNALNPESARVNEFNAVAMTRLTAPADKLLVRQISGAIARRIVCKAIPDQEFSAGQQFGMIKFGSRTELYLPASENAKCQVKVGDKVKAGLTVFVRYE